MCCDVPSQFTLLALPHVDGTAPEVMLSDQPIRPPLAGRTRPARREICPPQRQNKAHGWFGRVKNWLVTGWPSSSTAPDDSMLRERTARMAAAREDFFASVADLTLPAASVLLDRIEFAKSMRELWHLRAEVFALVSIELDQLEADRRLATLNRHFPTRAPRSGFGPLAPGKQHMWP